MLEKRLLAPLALVITGLIITTAAIFAERLGIDPSAGWGRSRIGLLVFGTTALVAGLLACYAPERAYAIQRRLVSPMDGIRKNARSLAFLAAIRTYWLSIPIAALVVLVYIWF
ncbi:MAG: hypothetical protein V1755_00345, partial [Chloroflexota bacterium]